MSRLVHVQTTIQTVFGLLDDEGNANPQQPVTVGVARFSAEAFAEAQQVIAAKRDEIAASSGELAARGGELKRRKPPGLVLIPGAHGRLADHGDTLRLGPGPGRDTRRERGQQMLTGQEMAGQRAAQLAVPVLRQPDGELLIQRGRARLIGEAHPYPLHRG